MSQEYWIAAIDVHKKVLAVVIAEVKVGEMVFQRRRFGTLRSHLEELAGWHYPWAGATATGVNVTWKPS